MVRACRLQWPVHAGSSGPCRLQRSVLILTVAGLCSCNHAAKGTSFEPLQRKFVLHGAPPFLPHPFCPTLFASSCVLVQGLRQHCDGVCIVKSWFIVYCPSCPVTGAAVWSTLCLWAQSLAGLLAGLGLGRAPHRSAPPVPLSLQSSSIPPLLAPGSLLPPSPLLPPWGLGW